MENALVGKWKKFANRPKTNETNEKEMIYFIFLVCSLLIFPLKCQTAVVEVTPIYVFSFCKWKSEMEFRSVFTVAVDNFFVDEAIFGRFPSSDRTKNNFSCFIFGFFEFQWNDKKTERAKRTTNNIFLVEEISGDVQSSVWSLITARLQTFVYVCRLC